MSMGYVIYPRNNLVSEATSLKQNWSPAPANETDLLIARLTAEILTAHPDPRAHPPWWALKVDAQGAGQLELKIHANYRGT